MTLTIHTEEDNQRQLLMTIEVAEERVEEAMRQTARRLAREVRIPGFRQGKAPYRVLLNRIGRDTLRGETIEEIIPSIFEEAVEQAGAEDFYGQPQLTEITSEPLVLKFTLPLPPIVNLGDYRSLRQEIEPINITDEAVDEALEQIRVKHQVLEEVTRPVETGDMVTLSGIGKLIVPEEETETAEDADDNVDSEDSDTKTEFDEGAIFFAQEQIDLVMDSEKTFPGTSFVDYLIGLPAGDETTFRLTFPGDYIDEELAGQEAEFNVTILNVKSRELPELDDNLARLEGNYETLADLRHALRENLEDYALQQAKTGLIDEMANKLLPQATFAYPPAAVEAELDMMLQSLKEQTKRISWEWEDYLRLQGLTDESIRDNLREAATERLKRNLLIRQLVLDEKLTIEAEDIDAAVEERVKRFDSDTLRDRMREYFLKGSGFDNISQQVLQDKLYERIKDILSGNAPDLEISAVATGEEAAEEEE